MIELQELDTYWLLIGFSLIILFSFGFNIISNRTNVPSVILLILLGFILGQYIPLDPEQLQLPLELLGTVGLIMIVLEASLDLELHREKAGMIRRAFFAAFIQLGLTSCSIAFLFQHWFEISFVDALLYAIPPAIISSAIIIPSVAKLSEETREFLVFEAAFSDILGIMFFYFVVDSLKVEGADQVAINISISLLVTLVLAVIFSYLLIILFQKFEGDIKLFLPISVLALLYAAGKLFHLSSLIFILVFGLLINNWRIFFRGKYLMRFHLDRFDDLLDDVRTLTIETSFLVRTLFFVVFGMTITVEGILALDDLVLAFASLLIIYLFREIVLRLLAKRELKASRLLAPRGLITILLFYAIPVENRIPEFDSAIMLLIIIVSSLLMMIGLVTQGLQKNDQEAAQELPE